MTTTQITFIIAYSLPVFYMSALLTRYVFKYKRSIEDLTEFKKRVIALEREKMHVWDGKGRAFHR